MISGKWLANNKTRYYSYVNSVSTPLFYFGFGLSYTEFQYLSLMVTLPNATEAANGVIRNAIVKVTNVGKYKGEEIIQLYLVDPITDIVRYWKRLIGFTKVTIDVGESISVTIPLMFNDLGFYGSSMKFGITSGEYLLTVGGSSYTDVLNTTFTF